MRFELERQRDGVIAWWGFHGLRETLDNPTNYIHRDGRFEFYGVEE
jgi:hypothetical protein